jgi:NAD(P)-dependent dehydrogenase (short-subunit alcohol dehydrogenase family)
MTNLGKKTTAEEALRGASLAGKTAIVTGASSGIGIETARVLEKAGAHVIRAVRNVDKAQGANAMALDLTDLASVRAFAAAFRATGKPLHLLVNNAGVMATPLGATAQGFELQLGTNHLGHFVLTRELLPLLQASQGRVVNVSSQLHERGRADRLLATLEGDRRYEKRKYVPFDAYGDSKLANILFTRQLAKMNVDAFCLHPGVIPTNLTRSMGIGGAIYRFIGQFFLKTVEQGAATSIYAATAPELAVKSGAYLSDCAIARPSDAARDAALAERVWALSETATA